MKLNISFQAVGTESQLLSLSKDTSGGGVCFFTPTLLAPGTVVKLQVRFPDRKEPVTCTGQVAWSGPLLRERTAGKDDPAFEAGIRFVDIAPADQKFILQYSTINAPPST